VDLPTRLKDVALSDSGFLFDPYTGLTFSTNASGRFMLERLKAGHKPDELSGELRKAFALEEGDDPARDAREFLLLLRENGVLPRDEG
jgi:hypothetical protein